MRVGLVGLGTVGSAVARRLLGEPELLASRAGVPVELAVVAVRDPGRERDLDLGGVPLTGDALAVARDPSLDVVIELMGGLQPAAAVLETALNGRRGVVTANKAVVSRHGPRLAAVATAARTPFRFEAAVGGGVPVIALLRDSLRGDRVDSVVAVINGTTNFVLDRMRSRGEDLGAAVAAAQAEGYAEADPAADIDGADAACKLAILAWLACGAAAAPDAIDTEGIRHLAPADVDAAAALDHTVKLIARAHRREAGMCLRVGPALVPSGHPLSSVGGADNGVILYGDLAGPITITGAGAGGDATASAVVGDLVSACRELASGETVNRYPAVTELPLLDREECETAAYLRVTTADGADADATVRLMLEDRGVPVAATVPSTVGGELLVLTDPAPRAVLDRALETLDTLPAVRRVSACLDRLTLP